MKPQEILKQARENSGYTQEVIAKKIGVSSRMYQRYEAGKFPKFKGEQIEKLDKLLGTNLAHLLYDNKGRAAEPDPRDVMLTGANVTLQDYIDDIKTTRNMFYTLLSSNLENLQEGQRTMIAYQKAWVDRYAEKESGGDPDKKAEIAYKMNKLVDDILSASSLSGTQTGSGKRSKE